ncbi:hypothetical protein [Thalassobacillus pellis]|uniref:hypothetical protein n=1 Tax=Thalassobacillus pellis TaxID=748008 RepID=UPI001960CA68|nr:hypothetical protein [Thalassobacillus pellis]MBM7553157.1 hypothetical protein [Thalassobacillus pellis]
MRDLLAGKPNMLAQPPNMLAGKPNTFPKPQFMFASKPNTLAQPQNTLARPLIILTIVVSFTPDYL